MRYYHGTGFRMRMLHAGSFVTTEFYLAVAYALRHAQPRILVIDGVGVEVAEPLGGQAYEGEYVLVRDVWIFLAFRPRFHIPADWDALDGACNPVHPHVYEERSWL